ncbi:MAG: SDR family oxidoreductase [Balneolaceae bacterium]|jgi:NAD(P)-dependent dehydrogenase (short-subunit alcohol dehydrogenase family)|nr:SDR family oxidoreductase [Balneolaceae bacterium]
MLLENKKIVIIGGTTGIGLAAARAFIREGARVTSLGLDEESCLKLEDEQGKKVRTLKGDATREGVAERAIEFCKKEFGGFNGLYHVAGGSGRKMGDGPLHELSLDGWNKTFELNLTSLMLSNRAAVRELQNAGKGGSILNMASVLGFSPSPRYFVTHAYAAAKGAVIGFTQSIASYYAKENIRINVITPGLIRTPMSKRAAGDEEIMQFVKTKQPLDGGRIGAPEDLDGAACYFLSDQSRFTTGQILSVDGGWDLSEGQYQHKEEG